MKKYIFETSTIFDEMVKEYGLDCISDLDISEEIQRQEKEFKSINTKKEGYYTRIEAWDYENGIMELWLEYLK